MFSFVVISRSNGVCILNLNVGLLLNGLWNLQVECACGEINSRSFLSKKEREKFKCERSRVEKLIGCQDEQHSKPLASMTADTHVGPSAFAEVLREIDPSVANEYEKVQEQDRVSNSRKRFGVLPDGSRVALDYAQPPPLQRIGGLSHVVYDMGLKSGTVALHDSAQIATARYAASCCITAQMREELLKRDIAHVDVPNQRQSTHRFIAARMCPQCFLGPLVEDEVNITRHFMC
jgi:hypothetical protein